MKRVWIYSLLFFSSTILWAQGPYAPAAGILGTSAMHKDSSAFVAWATQCELHRGWQDIANKNLGKTTVGDSSKAIGKSGSAVVSLGDSGVAILQFDGHLYDGVGPDFAVFENAFKDRNGGDFLELAFVEVSSDGENYFRFPAHSLTDTSKAVGSFGSIDPTEINNLAGKYYKNYGTPFDLAELKGIAGLDIQKITHVKIVDVVGTLNEDFATRDTAGRIINDPYPTAFPSGGFDLDAVGVVHFTTVGLPSNKMIIKLSLYPNPTNGRLNIPEKWSGAAVTVYASNGKKVFYQNSVENSLHLDALTEGIYVVHLLKSGKLATAKVLIK